MSSSRHTIQRPSQESPLDFTLSPTAVTHPFPGLAISTPSLLLLYEVDDFYAGGPSSRTERTNYRYGPSVVVGGSASSPPRQVPSGLLLPDF